MDEEKLKIVEEKAKLRAKTHQPIQHIIGFADFMGEKFVVNSDVLIPRDETEILVRKAIELIKNNKYKIALDMCTGSGCIACMIAKLTDCQVMGVDISTEAIHTAFKIWKDLSFLIKRCLENQIYSIKFERMKNLI